MNLLKDRCSFHPFVFASLVLQGEANPTTGFTKAKGMKILVSRPRPRQFWPPASNFHYLAFW